MAASDAIGPIWEANHVWLIIVVVLLFTCFPPAFGMLSTVLHIPLTLMLVGIVLRGSAFIFRAYDARPAAGGRDAGEQARWGRTFAMASVITPVLLGVCIGAAVSGRVGRASAALDRAGAAGSAAGTTFHAVFISPWLTPFALAVGGLTLALFAFLAAVYLTVEARDGALREEFSGDGRSRSTPM
ncbi:MAG: cytochrome d ubiquinol oxidase subunit II [Gemmatimonadaceae bacterium]